MTAQEYLSLLNYDQAGNVLIDVADAGSLIEAYDSLPEQEKLKVHKELGEL